MQEQMSEHLAKRRDIKARWKKAMENPLSEDEFVALVNSVNASGEIPEEYVVAFTLGDATASFRFVGRVAGSDCVGLSPLEALYWPSWGSVPSIELALAESFSQFAKRHGWTIEQTADRLSVVRFERFDALLF